MGVITDAVGGGGAPIVIDSGKVFEPLAFVSVRETALVSTEVGVPVIRPRVLIESPSGKFVAAKLVGRLVPVAW